MRTLISACIVTLVAAAPVAAQVCGDANGNDTVTVTDGVQALRAAAGLSSSCEDGCDVDGNGAITVSDGVNILRKAAGLAINEACEFTASEANGVVGPTFSVFGGMTKVPGVASGASAAAVGDCENGGTVETIDTGTSSAATFTNCQIKGAILDGTISRAVLGSGVALGFDGFRTTRIKTGEMHTLNGTLSVTAETSTQGTAKRLNGTLNVMSSKRGSFTLTFQRVLLLGDGSVRQGMVLYDLSKTTNGKIATVSITLTATGDFPVTILLRNQQVRRFTLGRDTLLLVPAV